MEAISEKVCCRCKRTKPTSDFYRDKSRKDGLYPRCKKCHNEAAYPGQVLYKALNPERVRAWNKRWYRENVSPEQWEERKASLREWNAAHPSYHTVREQRRRAKKAAVVNDFTHEQWVALQAAYRHCCAYCGQKPKRLTMDHVVPLADGGAHTVANIVPACGPCNARKNAKAAPTHQPHLLV